jgi:triosephosphate isomerase
MTRRLVAGTGWKMNMTVADTRAYADELRRLAPGLPMHDLDCFVLPPFTSLHAAHTALEGLPVAIGGQTMHWEASGAWTGEVSAPMLLEAGCRYVELAHSERLAHFGETYELVRWKVNAALSFGLTPILCIGETAEDKRLGRADAVLAEQVATALADQGAERVPDVILAYEPRWAIGAAAAATPDYVAARHQALRALVGDRFGPDAARRTRIIYGGSVTPANGRDLVAIADVDGLFVGRAAWSPTGFAAIISLVGEAARVRGA